MHLFYYHACIEHYTFDIAFKYEQLRTVDFDAPSLCWYEAE